MLLPHYAAACGFRIAAPATPRRAKRARQPEKARSFSRNSGLLANSFGWRAGGSGGKMLDVRAFLAARQFRLWRAVPDFRELLSSYKTSLQLVVAARLARSGRLGGY